LVYNLSVILFASVIDPVPAIASIAASNPTPVFTHPQPVSLLGRTFSALRYYNYRLWFTGQMVSLFGTWMQTTAQGYLISMTGSAAYLGYVGFAAGVPSWLSPFTVAQSPTACRRNLLLMTQTAMMILSSSWRAHFHRLVQPGKSS
jgi:hypothetical protein